MIDEASSSIKKMTESQRGKYLEGLQGTPFRLMFDSEGNVAAKEGGSYNAEALSVSLKQVSGNLKHAPTQAEVSESAAKMKDALEDIIGDRAHVVISDSMKTSADGTEGTRAFLDPETGVFYVNNKFKFDEKFTELATVIHELYHSAEGTKQSAELHRALGEFVQAFPEVSDQLTGGVEGIKASVMENYRDEKLNAMQQGYVNATEIDADILGKLLGSEEYVTRLAVRNESLVKKLYAQLKFARDNTKSKQARRALNKLTDKFGKALDNAKGGVLISSIKDYEDEEKENTVTRINEEKMHDTANERSTDINERASKTSKYSEYDKPITLEDIQVLRSIGEKSINSFTNEDIEKSQKWAHKFYKELGVKSPFFRAWFGDWRVFDKSEISIVSVPTVDISQVSLSNGNYIVNDTGWEVYAGKTLNDDTRHHSGGQRINVKALNSIDAILRNAILLDTIVSKPNTKKKSPNTAFLHKLYTLIEYNGQPYIAKTTVEEFYNETINDVSKRAYNLKAIKIEPAGGQLGINSSSSVPVADSIYSISDLFDFVKSYDEDFKPISVNENLINKETGEPLVFYHGTNTNFTAFDLTKSGENFGEISEGLFFFTDKKEAYPNSAKDYAKHTVETKGGEERIYECYIRIQKPLVVDSRASYDPVSHYDANSERIYDRYFNGDYDGIIVKDSTGKRSTSTLVIVDNASQIKSAEDPETENANIGTFDSSDINMRYSKTGSSSKGIDSNSKKVYNNVYTEYQYNSFGWLRANDILTSDQYKDFTQKFAQIKKGKNKNYVKSASGSYIIAIGGTNDGYGFGIDNILVYATGTIAYPKVEKIVKIDLYSEDDIEIVRSFIYAKERNKNAQASYLAEDQYGEELVSNIRREDLPDYQRYQSEARARRSGGESGRAYKSYITKQDGERDSGEAQTDRSINDRSSKTGKDTVEMSRGEVEKLRANYQSEKVFDKKGVSDALNGITMFKKLSSDVRGKLIESIWTGFNEHRAYDRYIEVMTEKIYATIMQETDFELYELDVKESKDAEMQLKDEIKLALQRIVDGAKESTYSKMQKKAYAEVEQEIKALKAERDKLKKKNDENDAWTKSLTSLLRKIKTLEDKNSGKYVSASQYNLSTFKGAVKALSKVIWRGDINVTSARKHIATLSEWYGEIDKDTHQPKNTMLAGIYNKDVAQSLKDIATEKGKLTVEELDKIRDIADHFIFVLENDKRVFWRDKLEDSLTTAKECVELIESNPEKDNIRLITGSISRAIRRILPTLSKRATRR